MMSHKEARAVLVKAWASVHPSGIETASPLELQIIQAICLMEGRYGDWAAKNNWGAYQCVKHKPPCVEGHCVERTDHRADGTPYQACYRVFETPEAGAAVVVEALTLVRPAVWLGMQLGDVREVAWQMRYGKPLYHETDAEKYAQAMWKGVQEIASAIGEPVAVVLGEKKAPPGGKPPEPKPPEPKQPAQPSAGDAIGPLVGLGSLFTFAFVLARRKRR